MSSYRRLSPPGYDRKPARTSTGTLVPAGYYPPPTSYDDRRIKDYTSPRTSSERVGRGATTLATEEKYDRYGRLISKLGNDPFQDPRRSSVSAVNAPHRHMSLSSQPVRTQDPRSNRPAIVNQPRDSTNPSRPLDAYDRGAYYADPVSSLGRQHRQSSSIDDSFRAKNNNHDNPSRRRDSLDRQALRDGQPREERRGYHLSGSNPKRSDEYGIPEYSRSRESYLNVTGRRDRSSSDVGSRERPMSLIMDSRPAGRDSGPPPSTRGFDRVNGRHQSLRDQGPRSPMTTRDPKGYSAYDDDDDDYGVRRRPRPQSEFLEHSIVPLSPTRETLRNRDRYPDPGVESRGFGLRELSPQPHPNREDVIDRRKILPAGMLPHRDVDTGRDADRRRDLPLNDREVMPSFDPDSLKARTEDPARLKDRGSGRDSQRDILPNRERNGYVQSDENKNLDSKTSDRRVDRNNDDLSHDQQREQKKSRRESDLGVAAGATAIAGAAALATGESSRRQARDDDIDEQESRGKKEARSPPNPLDDGASQRHSDSTAPLVREKYIGSKEAPKEKSVPPPSEPAPTGNEDDDYMMRLQREMERAKQSRSGIKSDRDQPREKSNRDRGGRMDEEIKAQSRSDYRPPTVEEQHRDSSTDLADSKDYTRALAPYRPSDNDQALEDRSSSDPDLREDERGSRVRIVEPLKEKEKPKGILRRPTVKFPEYPDEPRQGVAPHKDAPVSEAPPGSTHTKIPRSYVNPQALEEAGERFVEERDFVVVLRVMPKDQVDKLAERTRKIREERDKRYDERGRGDDKGSDEDDRKARSHRDQERRDRHDGVNEESDEEEKTSTRHHHDRDRKHRDEEDDEDDGDRRHRRRHHHRRHRRDEDDDDDISDDYEVSSRKSKSKAMDY